MHCLLQGRLTEALKEKEGKAAEESPAERKDGLREDSTLNEEGLVARRKV